MSGKKMSEDFIKNKSFFFDPKKENFSNFYGDFYRGGTPLYPPKTSLYLKSVFSIGLLCSIEDIMA